ncbi:DUF305 domain-containing protein [Streptomyces sp. NPDC048514]|uniref:DUF305 domain-containing protein n=1 Tax=Streptomyces sp. NPDC048514 TaxID=3365564 RepID=UPI003710C5EF
MTTRTPMRRATLIAVTAAAALVLSACGDDRAGRDGRTAAHHGASASATGHNAQDVAFAQGMVPHHRQALEMARLAADRASSARVRDLATRIEKAQAPEIRTLTGWLDAWGEQAPEAGMDHSGHAGSAGMTGMTGMMSDGDMAALKKATGEEFDTAFLSLMTEHHRGAVEMARTERAKGAYGPAERMADGIVTAQNAEIKEMNQLLGAR